MESGSVASEDFGFTFVYAAFAGASIAVVRCQV